MALFFHSLTNSFKSCFWCSKHTHTTIKPLSEREWKDSSPRSELAAGVLITNAENIKTDAPKKHLTGWFLFSMLKALSCLKKKNHLSNNNTSMVGKSKPIIWNLIWKETAEKCVGGISSQGRGDIPLSIQNKLLRNLTGVFLITRATESPLHTPLFKLSLHIPPAVNQLLFPALLQVSQTAPPPELHPSPGSVYTTGAAKTDDCPDGGFS